MRETVAEVHTDAILRHLAEGTASAIGEEFLKALVRSLAAALGMKWAFITKFADTSGRVRMLAYWVREGFATCVEYPLDGSPCETVLKGEVGYYPSGVHKLFPRDAWVVREKIESFLAIPMILADGTVIGHLAAADDQPTQNMARDLAIFRIFGARAAAEFERLQAERELEANEKRLATVLATAMDAVITINVERRILLFNQAAEQLYRCTAAWAIGQPIDRFVTRRDREAVNLYLGRVKSDGAGSIWIPEGLHGERSDGGEFPIEATLSPMQLGGELFFTIILRDLTERAGAESAMRRLRSENTNLKEALERSEDPGGMIGETPSMHALQIAVIQVAKADSTVLINGETGAGKELIAHAVHRASLRSEQPLITVNCAALPAELIESELFGHERGAFTGATTQRKGRFELADSGTLFLDEIGELSLPAQAKLLRVLQEQAFERVGGSTTVRVNVRLIAATNRDLAAMVAGGGFRADLYYRLNVFPLEVPPLRARREDIPALVTYFVQRCARKLSKPITAMAPLSMERLKRYNWPGNIRELQNVIERAAILSRSSVLEISEFMLDPNAAHRSESAQGGPLDDVLSGHIRRVLDDCKGVIEGPRGAAAQLGLKPSTLRHRMKLLGFNKAPELVGGAKLADRLAPKIE